MTTRRLLTSLHFKLILGFAVIIVLTMGGVSTYSHYAAAKEVERYEIELTAVRNERLERMVRELVDSGVRGNRLAQMVEQAGWLYGVRIAVIDENGSMISRTQVGPDYSFFGDSIRVRDGGFVFDRPVKKRRGTRKANRPKRDAALIQMFRDEERLGTLAFTTAGSDSFVREEPHTSRITDNFDEVLIWPGLAAGAGAIVVSMLVSRRTLSPLRSLRAAAERLGTGDLTQRVEIEHDDEVGDMAQTFNAMAQGLEQAELQRRVLMADVAHELRTPLANIQGYVEAIRDGLIEPDEATIHTLLQQVIHLVHITEDLRVLALAESGVLPLEPRLVSLSDIAEGSTEAFRARAEAKNVQLILETPHDPPSVEVDPRRISQVIDNLLENAIRVTPLAGVIRVTIEAKETGITLSVSDNGPGIPEVEIPQIFERFSRLDESRSRETGGVGLGLPIAKQLIEAHGGNLRVETIVGKGSTFIVEFGL